MTPAWKEALAAGAAALPVPVTPATVDALATFCDRLVEWNAKIDLSSIKDPDEIRAKHVLDSLSGFLLLRPADLRIADLGSGGGFPGVVLAIADPARTVVSVESRTKKAVFQRQVGRELGLKNLEVLGERIEDVTQKIPRPDLVTARALADLDGLLRLTESWLAEGTELLAYKSSKADDELAAAAARMDEHGLALLDRRDFSLPETGEPRTLLRIGRR